VRIARDDAGFTVTAAVSEAGADETHRSRTVVLCAGAATPELAELAGVERLSTAVETETRLRFDRVVALEVVVDRVDAPLLASIPGVIETTVTSSRDDVAEAKRRVAEVAVGLAGVEPVEARTVRVARGGDNGAPPAPREPSPFVYVLAGASTARSCRAAADIAGAIASALGRDDRLVIPMPVVLGGEASAPVAALADRYNVSELAVRRLASRHGTLARDVLARSDRAPVERAVTCPCGPVLECEVRHAIRSEGARDIAEVARRTGLGRGGCGGLRCAHRAAELLASERGLRPSDAHQMVSRFVALMERGGLARRSFFWAGMDVGDVARPTEEPGS
jgi:bacterioferritin-associated ferredoxin